MAADLYWRHLVLFHEYFHGEHGRGLGASHQTGWTALVTRCLEGLAQQPSAAASPCHNQPLRRKYTRRLMATATINSKLNGYPHVQLSSGMFQGLASDLKFMP